MNEGAEDIRRTVSGLLANHAFGLETPLSLKAMIESGDYDPDALKQRISALFHAYASLHAPVIRAWKAIGGDVSELEAAISEGVVSQTVPEEPVSQPEPPTPPRQPAPPADDVADGVVLVSSVKFLASADNSLFEDGKNYDPRDLPNLDGIAFPTYGVVNGLLLNEGMPLKRTDDELKVVGSTVNEMRRKLVGVTYARRLNDFFVQRTDLHKTYVPKKISYENWGAVGGKNNVGVFVGTPSDAVVAFVEAGWRGDTKENVKLAFFTEDPFNPDAEFFSHRYLMVRAALKQGFECAAVTSFQSEFARIHGGETGSVNLPYQGTGLNLNDYAAAVAEPSTNQELVCGFLEMLHQQL